jgi:transcriptional regulator with XRE-family HTH domain
MVAKQITNLRVRLGMTQQQLAKELYVGPSAIGMYEQGRRVPSVEMLVQMADLFDVSLDYLITGKEFSGRATTENVTATQPDCRCRSCCACCHPKE